VREAIKACPTPRRRSDLSPGIGRQHSLSHTTIASARSERVDPGPLGRGGKLGARKFDLRGGSRKPARRGNAFRGRHSSMWRRRAAPGPEAYRQLGLADRRPEGPAVLKAPPRRPAQCIDIGLRAHHLDGPDPALDTRTPRAAPYGPAMVTCLPPTTSPTIICQNPGLPEAPP
jgi:hypothetical protein